MSAARSGAAGRVADVARRWGIALAPGEADGLVGLVEGVETALARRPDPAASAPPGGGAHEQETAGDAGDVGDAGAEARRPAAVAGRDADADADAVDDSAWVWRTAAGQPLATEVEVPLAGWRVGVKDLVAVAGHPTRCGSAATWDAPVEAADAPVVAALRRAGARVVGATKLHEFAFGTTGINPVFGTPRNPAAPGRVPGGSSSGSGAAVAAGEADLAVGTDTGGSVRIPAALCGVIGYKPSRGALPTDGVVALSPTLDHVGFLVGDVERLLVASAALDVIAPAELAAAGAPGRVRLGVARAAVDLCEAEVAEPWLRAVEQLAGGSGAGAGGGGAIDVVEVDWPGGEPVFAATTAIMFAEAAHGHASRLARRAALYGVDVRNRLLQGAALDAGTYLRARDVRRELHQRCVAVLAGVDAVVTPTVPIAAPRLEEVVDPAVGARLVTFTRLADLTGLPAISLPVPGVALPVGLQLEAAGDAALLRAASAVAHRLNG